ncbi:glycosyltransferase [Heliobacterium gestii]|uniref:Glycosyltransferase n=1 Tax=Heliomicrobium gestii TaxID=2699 RepID=A0A845LCV6_HELGE|nr:glycosyltransferase [Heliomicrobium gestii]MBM7866456.1 glycosyltransferase involved in cell wall biosynthesis [Heliomicrobium gestii]MZP42760.1 glycosyltransferase [Heliomicrobium gestii]
MRTKTLSLCMIAKNEAENIARCLGSVEEAVDEIIVVDTGSVDDTMAIARRFGARLFEVPWKQDFSAARNASLDRATGDWILILDCDEEVDRDCLAELTDLVESGEKEAYMITLVNLLTKGVQMNAPALRLFRNRPAYRFCGRLHEQVVPAIAARSGLDAIGGSTIRILHHGYSDQALNQPAKVRRNMDILQACPEGERDAFFLYNLGTEHIRQGEREKGLACLLEALRSTNPGQGYAPMLVKKIATLLMAMQRHKDALAHLARFQRMYAEFRDLDFLEGLCHLNCGRYSRALDCLRRYRQQPSSPDWFTAEAAYDEPTLEALCRTAEAKALRGGREITAKPFLSLCVIGRNEGAALARCLVSAAEIADEIIYVDTGSDDDSVTLAEQLGAAVHPIAWKDSYAGAKNAALAAATGEWILQLDADEFLPDTSRSAIMNQLATPDQDAYILKICTFPDSSLSAETCRMEGQCRLFRNRGFRFCGHVGETIVPSLTAAGATVGLCAAEIHHLHGLAEATLIEEKRQRKMAAIEATWGDAPLLRHFALGQTCCFAGDYADAVRHFERCAELLQRDCRDGGRPRGAAGCDRSQTGDEAGGDAGAVDSGMVGGGAIDGGTISSGAISSGAIGSAAIASAPVDDARLFYLYGLSLMQSGQCSTAASLLAHAGSLYPKYTNLVYLQAVACCMLGRAAEAEGLFDRCLDMGEAHWRDYLVQPGEGSYKAACALVALYAQKGETEEALHAYLRLARIPPALETAMEGIAQLFDDLPAPLETVLAEAGLLQPRGLAVIVKTLAAMGRFAEALRWQRTAWRILLSAPPPRDYRPLLASMECLIDGLLGEGNLQLGDGR